VYQQQSNFRIGSYIERAMTEFVDEKLDDELLSRDDLKAAQQRVSEWLNESIQSSIFNRVSSLLKAVANRLIYDLECRGQDSALNLPKVASIQLNMASLKDHANKASEALSCREDEIGRLKREVARCERAVKSRKKKVETLREQSAQLENLEVQRKKAQRDKRQLGRKPNPKVVCHTDYKDKEVWRGGFGGRRKGIRDWLLRRPKRIDKVPITRQSKDHSNVKKWEREIEAAKKKVSSLDRRIKPLKGMRTKMQEIEGELPKLQREVRSTKAKLRRAEKRLLKEQENYRQAGIKTRRSQLKRGARRELDSLFDSLPNRLERESEQMLEEISKDFSTRFNETAAELLADEMEQRKKEARTADAERMKRENIRKTLAEALETFLSEDQGETT